MNDKELKENRFFLKCLKAGLTPEEMERRSVLRAWLGWIVFLVTGKMLILWFIYKDHVKW